MISSLVNLQVDALAKKGWKLEVLQKAENNGLALRNLLLQIGKRTECPCWKKKITVFAKKKVIGRSFRGSQEIGSTFHMVFVNL
jgi:hypothetical protein